MKCKVCGENFKYKRDYQHHLLQTACGKVDTSRPLVCSFEYTTLESSDIIIPMKIKLRVTIEHIESLLAETPKGKIVRTK